MAVLVLFAGACRAGPAPATDSQTLATGWHFRLVPDSAAVRAHPEAAAWRTAHVPGSVQTDLLAAGAVGDPFWRANEAALQWIGLADWQYELPLAIDAATLRHDHVELVFDGLDTFADVSLNGHRLLAADNMFRRWRVPVKNVLRAGGNTLLVTLHSPITRMQPWLLRQPYALPGEFDSAFGDEPKGRQTSNYVRKASYQYGWDWGPRYVTEGIWQPVRLETWDDLRLADFHIAQRHVDADVAQLLAQFDIRADHAGQARLRLTWSGPDNSRGSVMQEASLAAGDNHLELPVRIGHPQRWWPAGYGAPNLYRFRADVIVAGKVVASIERDTGLRSVELRRQHDRWGRSFTFVVNGVPIFAKGANLIPLDSFPERVTGARMQQVLESARDANMNMLRVWGGGYYQSDAFYAMADRLGLMIWQDFMFGGAVPPYDAAFRENARIEATEQVVRLRDHPSIVLWCGNNEVETGWESWPDRKKFAQAIGPTERARVEHGMRTLFGETLRGVVRRYAPDVPYWATSPGTDFDGPANVPDDGDMHVWDVWAGSAPIEDYLKTTPRFQSEYGLQSFPALATIRSFAAPADLSPDSPVMRAHQKFDGGNGNRRLLFYIRKYYGEPKDFASFVYLSQVMQAEGIELAADHLRSARPQSMGSLYWQLNDVWPGASWSSIDYFGRWKALQFHARRFYAPLRVVPIRRGGRTEVFLVSDRTSPLHARLRTRVMDMEGRLLHERTDEVQVPALASTRAVGLTDAALLQGADPHRSFAVFELVAQGGPVSRHLLFFEPALALQLPDPGLHAELADDGHGIVLSLRAERLAREVWVDFGPLDAKVSDNALDLLPGERVELRVGSTAGIASLRDALHVHSLFDATARHRAPTTPENAQP
ncbi:glycoside hydrolase family 2 protein [Rhodanobacter denitrificans]|uniref:Beta-mannosidase B n=1 Tax=Rhodanobacter denitrificans TaxID=666685 RepID=A0A368KFN2_9GAMM|nr:glycoside hydrolase family 2 protein [Rhodanobacter denitrificans]RCS30709.1 glycoside hydrolase family 2 protein [Rhodanobacter denitrificans]